MGFRVRLRKVAQMVMEAAGQYSPEQIDEQEFLAGLLKRLERVNHPQAVKVAVGM